MGERPVEAPRNTGIANPLTPIPHGLGEAVDEYEHDASIDPDRLLTVEEVARLMRIDARTVQKFLASQELIGVRIGRLWRVARADLRAFISRHRSGKT